MSTIIDAIDIKFDSSVDNELRDLTPSVSKCKVDSGRRARKNYLSMIGLAYALTMLSPGTILWSPSSPLCIDQHPISNDSTATLAPITFDNSSLSGIDQSAEQRNQCDGPSINIPVLAKLTCSVIVLLSLFFNLQGSNGGVLTSEVIGRFNEFENTNSKKNGDCHEEKAAADLMEEGTIFLEPPPLHIHEHQCQEQQPLNQGLYPHTRRKYCNKCKIHPPLRSHHCKISNQCIATFDHHCRFLDTCIGERNHFRFWMFITINILCVKIGLGIVGTGRVDGILEESPSSLLIQIGQAILLLSKAYMYTMYVIGLLLWMMHTLLALGNITTFEISTGVEYVDYLRGTLTMDLPFGKGPRRNLQLFFIQDDAFRWTATCFDKMIGWILPRDRHCNSYCKANTPITSTLDETAAIDLWIPTLWKMPEAIERDSEDWWKHPWQNNYWSCC